MKIEIPVGAKQILNTLNEANYAAYIVGGCVRDSLLGLTPKDWDITTNATPDEIEKLFPETIPTGKKYGTISVKQSDGQIYEVTTFRSDSNSSDGRRPDYVTFGNSILEDLERRDFTINAIAYNDLVGVVDPYNGMQDLENKIIRTVGKPEDRFKEDGLRVLRALRFSSKYNFTVEYNTKDIIKTEGYKYLDYLSKERINTELCSILSYTENINKLIDTYRLLFNKIFECKFDYNWGLDSNFKYLSKIDFYNTSLNFKLYTILALIKPIYEAEIWLRKYRFPNKTVKDIIEYYKIESKLISNIDINSLTAYDARIFLSEFNVPNLIQFIKDYKLSYFVDLLEANQTIKIEDLAIDGYDLKEFGIQGETIGLVKKYLLQQVLINPELNNKEALIELIQKQKEKYETDN